MRTHRAAAVMAAALMLAPLPTGALASNGCVAGDPTDVFPAEVPTLRVTVSSERPSYRRGQTAVVVVDVEGVQVGRATVHLKITSNGAVVREFDTETNETGQVRPRIKIAKDVPMGDLAATARASSELIAKDNCSSGLVYQVGTGAADPLTRVQK